jgi:hypothetical protein
MRERRFADADHADRFGFDQVNRSMTGQQSHKGRRGHPTGGAAADHHNPYISTRRQRHRYSPRARHKRAAAGVLVH